MLQKSIILLLVGAVGVVVCGQDLSVPETIHEDAAYEAPLPARSYNRIETPANMMGNYHGAGVENQMPQQGYYMPDKSGEYMEATAAYPQRVDRQHPIKKFGGHLKEFVVNGARGFTTETKPAVQHLKNDFGDTVHAIRNNRHVARGIEAAKPHYEKIRERTVPIIDAGGKKVNGLITDLRNRRNKKPHDGPVVPTVPMGAQQMPMEGVYQTMPGSDIYPQEASHQH